MRQFVTLSAFLLISSLCWAQVRQSPLSLQCGQSWFRSTSLNDRLVILDTPEQFGHQGRLYCELQSHRWHDNDHYFCFDQPNRKGRHAFYLVHWMEQSSKMGEQNHLSLYDAKTDRVALEEFNCLNAPTQ